MNQKHIYNIFVFDIWWKILISMISYTQEIISPDNIGYLHDVGAFFQKAVSD